MSARLKSQVELDKVLAGSVQLDDPIYSELFLDDPIYSQVELYETNEPVNELFYRASDPQGIRMAAPEEYRRPV